MSITKEPAIGFFVYNLGTYSGAAAQALLLAQNLNRRILIFNFQNDVYQKRQVSDQILIIDMPKSRLAQIAIVLYFTFSRRLEIYHLHGFIKLGLLIGLLTKRHIILKTTLLNDDDFDSVRKSAFGFLKTFLLRRVTLNVVLSENIRTTNAKHMNSRKIIKIPNGVQLPSAAPPLEAKEHIFCYVGLVCERKRTFEAIQCFLNNFAEQPSAVMCVVGPYEMINGNKEFSTDYVRKCFDLVRSHNASDKVMFLGQLDKRQISELLAKSKALFHFSENEGMPNVVLEAMAHNCVPVVSEMHGVGREILGSKLANFVLEKFDEPILIEEIENHIRKKRPYERACENFSIHLVAREYQLVYDAL